MTTARASEPTVSLRQLTGADCRRIAGWIASEDDLYQWSGPADFSWPLTVDQLLGDLARAGGGRLLLAATAGEGALVGHVKLAVAAHHRIGHIGRVVVAPDQRGRGMGTALMRAVVALGFDELGLHRLQLGVYAFNTAAIACYQGAGFVVEGRLRDSTLGSDGYWQGLTMSMLESDQRPREAGPEAADGLTVRAARLGDRGAVAALLTQLGYEQSDGQTAERLIAWAGDPGGAALVAESNGAVAGVIAVHAVPYFERPDAFARIVALSVDAGCRRGGLGRALVAAAEAWAAGRGCVDMEVTSQRARDDAHGFYRALGYADQCDRSGRLKRRLP
ncbi:MAG TPA: GNAT family N-acetyltransferase [Solirubrobacteraceae bacterium]|jgi:RimJ/RimL family protein N-acetyltransferase|nr:GNAT family N-acetyltransferase [Solirubrobacteraceae bacterium]